MGLSMGTCPLSDAHPQKFALYNADSLSVLLKQGAICRFENWYLLLRCSVQQGLEVTEPLHATLKE